MDEKLLVPDIGDFEKVEVIEILVKEGDEIKINDPVVTIESDKSSVEIPSTISGKIKKISINIFGYDKSPSAIIKAKENIELANLKSNIKIFQKDFFDSKKQGSDSLHIVTNPPYGERLKGDINSLYSKIGDSLKLSFSNTNFWFISSNFEAMKHFGLRPSRKIKLFNGKLESRLLFFPIYEGTKKVHKK